MKADMLELMFRQVGIRIMDYDVQEMANTMNLILQQHRQQAGARNPQTMGDTLSLELDLGQVETNLTLVTRLTVFMLLTGCLCISCLWLLLVQDKL